MFQREGTRSAFIVVLLVMTLLLTAVMAVRAQLGEAYRRATATKVICDWARVAADELARRTEAQAGFNGTYPLLQSLLAGENVQSPLIACSFRYDGTMVTAPECAPSTAEWLRPRLAAILAAPPPPADRKPLHDGPRTFVYALPRDATFIAGIEVNRAALGPYFQSVLDTQPLIPTSLAQGRITNEAMRIRVVDGARLVFSAGPRDGYPAQFAVPDGLLLGMTIEAAVDPALAPLLVFGGIPRLLPIYWVLFAATALLLVTALLQLRKERALARLRSDFVAGVSHELRTPLTQIRMFAETLLLDRVRSDDERRRSLAIIDQETRRLAQLVDNVLQFSRGQRGTLRLVREQADVAALIEETVATFRPIAAARGVTVATTLQRPAMANLDRDAVRQIVLNLLDNAVKYGPPSQEVRVSVERTADAVRIVVDDAGPGIPRKARSRIWRRYERLARERDRAVAGAGIGLAVVRDLVALHGGSARVEDSSRGGAAFIVELPS